MRKLASIQRIDAIEAHPNADNLEMASILGWRAAVPKGCFSVGDPVVWFEIDSFLPVRPEFEFLRKGCYRKWQDGTEGFRLRTICLRGQVSQGLALPLNDVPGLPDSPQIGDDVAAALGVIKYDPPVPAQISGIARGNFPPFIRKTDQERIQNVFGKLSESHRDTTFEVSVKLDGTSMTVYWFDGQIGVCSRNLDLVEDDGNAMWRVARSSGLVDILARYGRNLAVQGELMGPGIQKNRENLSEPTFFVFDIWDINRQRYLTPAGRHDMLNLFGRIVQPGVEKLRHVPVLHEALQVFEAHGSCGSILAMADGPSMRAPIREGLVFKATDGSVSFKAISNAYLLKTGE